MICYGDLIIKITDEFVVFRSDSALLINSMLEVDAKSPFPRRAKRTLFNKRGKHKMEFRYTKSTSMSVYKRKLIPIFTDSKFNFDYNVSKLSESNNNFQIVGECNQPLNYIALVPLDIYTLYKYKETQYLVQLNYHLKEALLPDITPLIMIPLLEILRTDISTYKVIEPY
jgi:hypothetical protein